MVHSISISISQTISGAWLRYSRWLASHLRSAGSLPSDSWLSAPQCGGSMLELQSLLNLSSYQDYILVIAWLLASLRPLGPYPLLALAGEQGSAKTITCKLLKALIDP